MIMMGVVYDQRLSLLPFASVNAVSIWLLERRRLPMEWKPVGGMVVRLCVLVPPEAAPAFLGVTGGTEGGPIASVGRGGGMALRSCKRLSAPTLCVCVCVSVCMYIYK